MNLGRIFIAYREYYQLSIRTLAQVIGISFSTIARIEKGETCDLKSWRKIQEWMLGAQ